MKTFLKILILLLFFVLVSVRATNARITVFPVRPVPLPTRFPLPTIILPPPFRTGTVELKATMWACTTRPFAGEFKLCTDSMKKCYSLETDTNGYGKISLPSNSYTVYPPSSCKPGTYCVKGYGENDIKPLFWEPVTWQIDPQNFFLKPRYIQSVKAWGYNNLLGCPIENS